MDLLRKALLMQGACIWNPNGTHNGTSTLVGQPEQQTRPDQLMLADRMGWELPLVFVPELWVQASLVVDQSWSWPGGWEGDHWIWVLTSPRTHLTRFNHEFDVRVESFGAVEGPQTLAMCNLVEPE